MFICVYIVKLLNSVNYMTNKLFILEDCIIGPPVCLFVRLSACLSVHPSCYSTRPKSASLSIWNILFLFIKIYIFFMDWAQCFALGLWRAAQVIMLDFANFWNWVVRFCWFGLDYMTSLYIILYYSIYLYIDKNL